MTSRLRRVDGGRCAIEALEPREFFASDLLASTPPNVLDLLETRPATINAPAIGPLRATPARQPYPQVEGLWIGTCKTVGKKRPTEIDVRITRQSGPSATGKFALGPATTWHKVLSTAVLTSTLDRSFRVILPGADFYGSLTATISANGQQILGRWTCNVDGNWKSGTLVLNRQ